MTSAPPRSSLLVAALLLGFTLVSGLGAQEGGSDAKPAPASAPASPEAKAPPPAPSPSLAARRFTLPSGLRVVVVEQPGVSSFTATFLHEAGTAREWQGLYGAAQLVGAVLQDGTRTIGTRNWKAEQKTLADAERVDRALSRARDALANTREAAARDKLSAQISTLEGDLAQILARHQQQVDPTAWKRAYEELGGAPPRVEVSHDAISYSATLPSTSLSRFLKLEGQRLSDGVPRSFFEARDHLHAQWTRGWSEDPAYALLEGLAHTVWNTHPYGRYKATPAQLQGLDYAELGFYLRTFTAPSRTVLAIVGGVDASEVERLTRESLPRASVPPAAPLEGADAPQRGERRLTVRRPGPVELVAAFHVETPRDPAVGPALAVLVEMLAHPTDGLLRQALVAAGVHAGTTAAALFPAGGPLGPDDAPALLLGLSIQEVDATCRVEATLWHALAILATDGPPAVALEAARARARARLSSLWADHAHMAPAVAWTTLTEGDPAALVARYEALAAVDAAAVRALAARVFDPMNRTVALGWPGELGGAEAGCAARSATERR